jgi:hypothetical protein
MTFRSGKPAPVRTLRLSAPDGGINQRESPLLIADNQLSDADNWWWRDGRLCTRPGMASTAEGIRPQADNVTITYAREDVADTVDGEVKRGRRFVERTGQAGGAATFRIGTLYYKGITVYPGGAVTVPASGGARWCRRRPACIPPACGRTGREPRCPPALPVRRGGVPKRPTC